MTRSKNLRELRVKEVPIFGSAINEKEEEKPLLFHSRSIDILERCCLTYLFAFPAGVTVEHPFIIFAFLYDFNKFFSGDPEFSGLSGKVR